MASNFSHDITESDDRTICSDSSVQLPTNDLDRNEAIDNSRYAQAYTILHNDFTTLMLVKDNQSKVVSQYQKICDHLHDWKTCLDTYISLNGPDSHTAKLHHIQVEDNLKSSTMLYREFVDSCATQPRTHSASQKSKSRSSKSCSSKHRSSKSRSSKSSMSSSRMLEKSKLLRLEALQEKQLAAHEAELSHHFSAMTTL